MKLIDFGTAKRFDLGPLTTKVEAETVGKMWDVYHEGSER